jgi:hypothetical protein
LSILAEISQERFGGTARALRLPEDRLERTVLSHSGPG